MVQIKIGITEQLKAQLRQESKDKGLSMSECVRKRLSDSFSLEQAFNEKNTRDEQQFYQSNYKRQEKNDKTI